jgi:cell wall-associated NlpC family hydrolase
VRGWDGYPGWVRDWSLRPLSRRAARGWEARAVGVAWGLGVIARPAGGAAQALPWGARLVPFGAGRRGLGVLLPDGRRAMIGRRQARSAAELARARGGSPAAQVVRLVRSVLGCAYHWGGTSPAGFDCSGLVQWAHALAGVPLPRDAGEQRAALPAVAGRPRAGDLLFFGRGEVVNHVAVVTHPPLFVHAYGRVEETHLGRRGRPELRAILLGAGRPVP